MTAAFQSFQVLKHRIEGREVEMFRDLFHARRISVLIDKFREKIQNFLLSFCQFHIFTFYTLAIIGDDLVKVKHKKKSSNFGLGEPRGANPKPEGTAGSGAAMSLIGVYSL